MTHAAVGLIDLFFRQGRYEDRPGMPQPPFIPGLEVAGTVRARCRRDRLRRRRAVVSMSAGGGVGCYGSVFVAPASVVVSTEVLSHP